MVNTGLELVAIAAVTAIAAAGGTWWAGRLLQERDQRERGKAAGRLIYLELEHNYQVVTRFRKATPGPMTFFSRSAWVAGQQDLARFLPAAELAKVVLPYAFSETVEIAQRDWFAKAYAKLSGYERQWFDGLESALSTTADTLGSHVWTKEQREHFREVRYRP